MKVEWSPQADADLRQVYAFIAPENPTAAEHLVRRILWSTEQLTKFPFSGRPGRVAGTRELVIVDSPFIVAYRVLDTLVEIIAVIHAAREWPQEFDEL